MKTDPRMPLAKAYAEHVLGPLGDFPKRKIMAREIAEAWLKGYARGRVDGIHATQPVDDRPLRQVSDPLDGSEGP